MGSKAPTPPPKRTPPAKRNGKELQPSPPPPPKRGAGPDLFALLEPGVELAPPRQFIDLTTDGGRPFSLRAALVHQVVAMEPGEGAAAWSLLILATGERIHVREPRHQVLQLLGDR